MPLTAVHCVCAAGTSLESLTEALELTVLARSIGPPGEGNAKKTKRATPDYKASPSMLRAGSVGA